MLRGPDEGGLRRAFVVWLQRVLLPSKGEADIPEIVELEEFHAMLEKRVEEWNRQLRAEGRKEGWKEGQRQGREESRQLLLSQLEVKFGEIDARTQARIRTARPERLLLWGKRLITAERLADVFAR